MKMCKVITLLLSTIMILMMIPVFENASQILNWTKGAVDTTVNVGYLSVYADETFYPNKGIIRAKAVSTLYRVLGNITQQQTTAPI